MRDPSNPYWDAKRETRDPKERDAETLGVLQAQLKRAYNLTFYQRHWDAHGFHPDQVKTLADFTERCPIITKKMLVADQAEFPPFGSYLGIDTADIFRIHGSSGTSGTPTIYGVARQDWEQAKEIFRITHWASGVRPSDRVHYAFPFGMFFGGWAMLMAAEEVGATTFPMGAADTRRHIEMIDRLQATVIEATPSYMLHMAEVAKEIGYDAVNSPIKIFMSGGEPGGSIPSTKKLLMELWGLDVVSDAGTSSEMFPFVTNAECREMNGMHIYNDEVWTELVDPEDNSKLVPEGEIGSLIYTHLHRVSQPMIRFAVNDRSWMTWEPCTCGRTYPRLPQGLMGRTDDMLVIRGANIFPSAVEKALRGVEGLGTEFRIRVSKQGYLDEMVVEAEVAPDFTGDRDALTRRATDEVNHHCLIRVPVSLVEPNTFERAQLKSRRVIDERPKE
ncbi:phenylacetate--CoA ligase family protein [Sporichthya sp.]|uniref:phenylacetate--CoA ligase family protein n=1 Tax=Sporichthya sp. TaxID=65475 RepID=UPI0017F3D612|nr:AMP-binding protein [Sporichthya sp.]MBA3743706.1 phenylacetate--CoA ligase family protein [Sporichthya sp.]